MAELPPVRVTRRMHLSLTWVVPLVAALVAGWMLYRQWRDRGPEIRIHFTEGAGVQPGQTRLHYKGVVAGTVTDVSLDDDLHGVLLVVRLRREAAALARRGTQFWIVQPRVGFTGVSGLETLVAGVHLNARPGTGPRTTFFEGLDQPPAPEAPATGRAYLLFTDQLGTMQSGAPVFYRDFQVGEVENLELADDARAVVVRIRVRHAYTDLVRGNTRFWNAGGVPVRFNLFGAEVPTASLRSFFTGAIGFATPDVSMDAAAENTPFRLHAAPESDWLRWRPPIPIAVPDFAEPPAPASLPALLSDTAPPE